MVVILKKGNFGYDKDTRTFTMSEKDVMFATKYEIKNPDTGNSMEFNFTHSTGPEFASDTKWIYKSTEGYTLEVCNDPEITKKAAENYLAAKTRNF